MDANNSNSTAPEKESKKNIFSMPLTKEKRGKLEIRKRNYRKGFIYLGITAILLGAYSFTFFYPQLQEYLGFNQKISAIEKKAEDFDITLSDLAKTKEFHKAAYEEQYQEEQAVMEAVFPEEYEKLEIIRLLENFSTHLNTAYPPFEFTSISFQVPKKKDDYTVLPFQTSIHASKENFDRFLGLINLSGNTDAKAPDHIRLMEISNITLNYLGPDKTGKDQGVNFNVQLYAYSR